MRNLIRTLCISICTLGIVVAPMVLAAPILDDAPESARNRYSFDGDIYATVSDGETLYIGGDFSLVTHNILDTENIRNNFAAIDLSSYLLTDLDPNFNGVVRALALSSGGETLYVGGDFTTANDGDTSAQRFAIINTETDEVSEPAAVVDGAVYVLEMSSDGETLYVGGDFSSLEEALFSGEGAPFNETTHEPDASFPAIVTEVEIGETIYSAIPDGDGGWYIGGTFNTVDGVPTGPVVHILSDNTLDADFQPEFTPQLFSVVEIHALVLSPDGETLYVGGGFIEANGISRNGIAAFNTSDGTLVETFDANLEFEFEPGYVGDMILFGSTLYVGGGFSEINGDATARYGIAAVDAMTGSTTAFDLTAEVVSETTNVSDMAISADGSTLYIAGDVGFCSEYTGEDCTGTARYGILKIDTAGTGTVDPLFAADPSSGPYAIALSPDENTLYVSGEFTEVNTIDGPSAFRTGFAAFDADDGSVTALNIPFDGEPSSMEFGTDSDILYVGGGFEAEIDDVLRTNFAALDLDTETWTAFAPSFNGTVRVVSVPQGGEVFIGGSFTEAAETFVRDNLFAFSVPDLSVTDFDPDINDVVRSLAVSSVGDILYAGGVFTAVNGAEGRVGLAAFTTDDSVATDFDANLAGGDGLVFALALLEDATTLYIGGSFETVGGEARLDLAAVDGTTGAPLSFDADLQSCPEVETIYALTLTDDEELLYVGGCFVGVGEENERTSLAALNTSDGTAGQFNPTLEDELSQPPYVWTLELSHNDAELYAGFSNNSHLLIFSGEPDEEPVDEDEDEDGGGGGFVYKKDLEDSARIFSGNDAVVESIMRQIIELLQQLIALLIAQQDV